MTGHLTIVLPMNSPMSPTVARAVACYSALRALGLSHYHARALASAYLTR